MAEACSIDLPCGRRWELRSHDSGFELLESRRELGMLLETRPDRLPYKIVDFVWESVQVRLM